MTVIINTLKQGNKGLAAHLISHALPYQINQTDAQGQTALHIAVQKNYLDIMQLLLENGANINATANDPAYQNMTPLHYAAITGNLAATELLLAWDADIQLKNSRRQVALVAAYQNGFTTVARAILQHKNRHLGNPWPPALLTSVQTWQQKQHHAQTHTNGTSQALATRTWVYKERPAKDNIIDFSAYRKKRLMPQ